MDRIAHLFAVARGETDELPPEVPVEERRVLPSGPLDARIAIIAESAGSTEIEEGRPLVGKSGQLLRRMLRAAGLKPDAIYMDNCYPYYPPGGKIGNVNQERLDDEIAKMRERLGRLTAVQVIVPTGAVALRALLGLDGITRYRGSIYSLNHHGRHVKVIPIIHPAAVLRGQAQWARRGYLDWARIARQSTRATFPQLLRRFTIQPTDEEIATFVTVAASEQRLAIDIETKPSEDRITCIGFSLAKESALVLTWDDPRHRAAITTLCALPCAKEGWNFLYDRWWLEQKGVPVAGRILDGMTMLHAVMPTDNVGLAYAASLHTFEPYWKDESKDTDDRTADENWQQYLEYCAKDVAVTRELVPIMEAWLEREGLTAFHRTHYEELAAPMLEMMRSGVRIDHQQRQHVQRELQTAARETRDALAEYNNGEPLFTINSQRDQRVWAYLQKIGHPVAPLAQAVYDDLGVTEEQFARSRATLDAKTVSKTKLRQLLYGTWEVPAHYKRRSSGEETETLDTFALRSIRYAYRDDAVISRICDLALEHARVQKLTTFITDDKYDDDGRMRFSLKVTTEAGRLASSASPRGKKNNSQNIPRDARIRGLVLPDAGHVCLQVDGAQAEARVCFVRTHDEELLRLAQLRSGEYDHHRHTAVICGFAPSRDEIASNFDAITKSQRQVAKAISHGSQRAMQGSTLAQTIIRNAVVDEQGEPLVYSADYCESILEEYHKRFSAIRQWHHQVRRAIRRDRKLTNAWGRIWPVAYFEGSDELYRRGYSFLLQSDIADWLNMFGLKAVYYWLRQRQMRSRVMLQEHDGLVISCHPDEAYDVALFLRDSLEQPWPCAGEMITVPVEFQLGPRWGQGVEFGELPSREAFEQDVWTCVQSTRGSVYDTPESD